MQMSDRIFIDSNIIIYAFSKDEIIKAEISNNLIFGIENACISKQVINEVINILGKKFKLASCDIENVVLELKSSINIFDFSIHTQIQALKLKERYQLQYYDSLIISTALENNCSILYSEDMQHKQLIENKLTIINPFFNIK
jgi:predicted nucleic acid-binding protein